MNSNFIKFVVILLVLTSAISASALKPRHIRTKPEKTEFQGGMHRDIIEVKFIEGSSIRLRNGGLISQNRMTDISELNQFFRQYPTVIITRMFRKVSEDKLTQDKLNGEHRSNQELADLNLWYLCKLDNSINPQAFVDGLNKLSIVEIAYPSPIPEVATLKEEKKKQSSIPAPLTPDYTGMQNYLYEAPSGVNAVYAWTYEGGRGEQMKWIDIENGWNWDHEDSPQPFFVGGTPYDYGDHGIAVVGEVSGLDNDYGITGIAPEAQVGCVGEYGWPDNLAACFYEAYEQLDPGDLFLIELHAPGPNNIYICMEWWQANFDAIQTITSNGILCTEAAGNGGANFDDPLYQGLFDREVRDSGAIICGAADPVTLQRLDFSCYGSRLDSFGWGINVTTTGYGDLQGGDRDEWYTSQFSGTSSASPIVTGAVLCAQGILKGFGAPPMSPLELRSLLTATGTPQSNPAQYIGTLPNLVTAIDSIIATISAFQGTITDSATGEFLRDVQVYADDSSRSATSDTLGFYHLSTSPGTYNLNAKRFGYYDFVSQTTYTLATQETVHVDIQLNSRPMGTLLGVVVNELGEPLPNTVFTPIGVPVAPFYTNANGEYEITLPGDYQYTLEVYAPDHDPQELIIEVPAGGQVQVDIEMIFVESFELSNGQFEGSGEWEWGIPSEGGGPAQAYMGEKCWGTDLNENYNAYSNYYLYSPQYTIDDAPQGRLKFYNWYQILEGWDGGNVSITLDGGETWEIIEPIDGYPDNSVVALTGKPGYTGDSQGWELAEFDLSQLVSNGDQIQFKFRFASTNSGDKGWFIDNMALYGTEENATSIVDIGKINLPQSHSLSPNYPNPFNPTTTISFTIPQNGAHLQGGLHLSLNIYDISGKLIKTLIDGPVEPGYHSVVWNGNDDARHEAPSGLYFYQIKTEEFTKTRQCLLLK